MKRQEINHLLLWIFAIIIAFLLNSCDVLKYNTKDKAESEFSESINYTTYRKGDTVRYNIPAVRFKDTTILKTNTQGTTIATRYDNNGDISSIDCFSSTIQEIREENRKLIDSIKNKEASKEKTVNVKIYMYIVIGVVVIFIFIIIAMFFYFNNQTNKINETLKNLIQ